MKPAPRKAPLRPDRVLGLLGLGQRARTLAVGVERVREALRDRQVQCLVVAADASSRTREKVVRLAAARRVPVVAGPPADELGARLGLATVQVVGVLDRALAVGLLEGPGGMAHRED